MTGSLFQSPQHPDGEDGWLTTPAPVDLFAESDRQGPPECSVRTISSHRLGRGTHIGFEDDRCSSGDSINDLIRFGGYSWTALLDSNSATAEANELQPCFAVWRRTMGDHPDSTGALPLVSWTAPISGSVWCIASIHMTPPHLVPEAFLAVYILTMPPDRWSGWRVRTRFLAVVHRHRRGRVPPRTGCPRQEPVGFNVGLICGEPLPLINDAPSQAWDPEQSEGSPCSTFSEPTMVPGSRLWVLLTHLKMWQPVSRGGNSVWYVWIAPSTGPL